MRSRWLERWRGRRADRRQAGAYRRIWQSFERTPTLADGRHDDERWRDHDGVFACCMIRIPADDIEPCLGELRQSLSDLGVARLHPDHFLHLMLQEIGFVCDTPQRPDEITPDRFNELLTAFRGLAREVEPFALAIGGANSFEDAAFLEVRDRGASASIHGRLREIAAVPMIPRYPYLPHVTICHYTDEHDPLPTISLLREWRPIVFGSVRVTSLEICTLRVDIDYAPFETRLRIPLKR